MLSDDEVLALARRVQRAELSFDHSPELEALDEHDKWAVVHAVLYRLRPSGALHAGEPAQRKARKLFRSWLTDDQLKELRRRDSIRIVGSAGGVYRIRPHSVAGSTERVELHGKYWFAVSTFCLHDEDSALPAADVALAHMLWILADEPGFLARANEHRNKFLWNSEWLRRLSANRRRARQIAAWHPELDAHACLERAIYGGPPDENVRTALYSTPSLNPTQENV